MLLTSMAMHLKGCKVYFKCFDKIDLKVLIVNFELPI